MAAACAFSWMVRMPIISALSRWRLFCTTVNALLMARVACSFVCMLIRSSWLAPNICNTLVPAPAVDATTLIPCASASNFFVSEASPLTCLFTSSITSRSSPAFLTNSSSFRFNFMPSADAFSASDIWRYAKVVLAISFVRFRSSERMPING